MADPQALAIRRDLDRLAERTVKKITLDITANLIETTPVDSGWARANWIPSVTKPTQETDGTREQAQSGSVKTGLQRAGQARVAGYQFPQGAVFIANNVPYILKLNDGTSTQAPSGFIEQAIEKALREDVFGLAT